MRWSKYEKQRSSGMIDVAVIGGGAAGFYGAIHAAERNPAWRIVIFEKTGKLLSKVRISGGGRCNVTHHCFNAAELSHHYPRGGKFLKELFKTHQASDVVSWFSTHGVRLKTEEDGRMFPTTDSSYTIIDCFLRLAERANIKIELNAGVKGIHKREDRFELTLENGKVILARKVLVAIGGHPNPEAYEFLRQTGHTIVKPIPSLFTFNDAEKKFTDLMGVAVPRASIKIAGTKFQENGPVLITHWGLSGPAVIRLSAWAAEFLHQQHYQATVLVSWIGETREELVRSQLTDYKQRHKKRTVVSYPLYDLPQRLWAKLCVLAEVNESKIWDELPQKNLNKLLELLIRCSFQIKGKTTFKEEFVTCGGVDLREVNPHTMESRKMPGLFFAGEVMHVDGETGGFNFQAAWTTSFIAVKNL